jgi:hypothetical protein
MKKDLLVIVHFQLNTFAPKLEKQLHGTMTTILQAISSVHEMEVVIQI